jgi:energy-coupling factor transporter transmembrane protein EcfT
MKLTPAIKGFITAALMITIMLIEFKQGENTDPRIQFVVYGTYGLGIIWTLLVYRQSGDFTGKFVDLFSLGFKCFVVVTLCIALFYGVFNYMHPEFREKMAVLLREELNKLSGEKQLLPAQIDTEVATYKKQYILKLVSGVIFGYLIMGAAVTAAVSALLMRRSN